MEEYVLYLFYLAIILILGILITAATNKFRFSNILFLVIAGQILKIYNLDYFNEDIVLVLSALALILIVIETTLDLDLGHIIKNFFNVVKFSVGFFIICVYFMALLIFQIFDIPGKGFEVFALCILLGIIIYGANPSIALEFLKRKKTRVIQMLEIEGIISGPVIVVFSLYLISYLSSPTASFSAGILFQILELSKQIFIAVTIGFILAWLLHQFLKHFEINNELSYLFLITLGIIGFVAAELTKVNGSLAVAIYGVFLAGFIKKRAIKQYTPLFTHALYIIVFILLGIRSFFPDPLLWIQGLGVFVVYLILRFACILLLIKDLKIKDKIYMTLNVSKGIEVAIVLFIMQISLKHIPGIDLIVSLGFMFFVYSYVVSTVVNRASKIYA